MKGDETLGFYAFEGTVYVNVAIAEDRDRLVSTVNHEMTHQILAHTTGSGVMLEILRSRGGSADGDLYGQLWAASRTVHEATATYAGLVDHTGPALRAELDRLPDFYRQVYAYFADLFAGREWPPLERYRTARAIGARALQTAVYDHWLTGELWRPERLREHLADPRHHPGARLEAIIAALRSVPDAVLREWSGRHLRGGSGFVLRPAVPGPLAGLDFHPLPEGASLRDGIRDRAGRTELALDSIAGGGRLDIALAPPPFRAVDADDPGWARDADLALVVPNALDTPYVYRSLLGGQEIPPHSARVFVFRPDFPAARRYTVPLAELSGLLDRIDPAGTLPVCLTGNSSWLPPSMEVGGRRLLMYTGGGFFGLTMASGLLETRGSPLLIHRMLGGATWGLVLLRSPGSARITIVHPILLSEWDRLGPTVYEQFAVEPETDPADFFPGGAADAAPAVAFLRVYRGLTMALPRWRELAAAMAADESAAPHRPVAPTMRRTEYDDAG